MNLLSAAHYFEEQYVLRKTLPSFNDEVQKWEGMSTDACFSKYDSLVEQYGSHDRQSYELFKNTSDVKSKGLAIFIHGGFWRAMNRQQSRFVATPFLENGYDCVIAEYRLMPEYRLADLVQDTADMLAALTSPSGHYPQGTKIILSGHSAGAHLAVHGKQRAQEMGCQLYNCSLLLFSGVFDLYPVHKTSIGDELVLSAEELERWSAYNSNITRDDREALFVVGGSETDEFKRQSIIGSQLLGTAMTGNVMIVPDANHLSLMTQFSSNSNFTNACLARL